MKKQRILNIILLCLTFCSMISVTFGWWTGGLSINSFVIQSANISTTITLQKGVDFNYDGNLDKEASGASIYSDVGHVEKATNNKKVLVLNFDNLYPTEVHTWKIKVENNGDANGVVYAKLHPNIKISLDENFVIPADYKEIFNDGTVLIKYMSITSIIVNEDGSVLKQKSYLYDFVNDKFNDGILFGNTVDYIVECLGSQNESNVKEFIFQIQVEPLENLNIPKEKLEAEKPIYQLLQGASLSESFEFLDISLSGEMSHLYIAEQREQSTN